MAPSQQTLSSLLDVMSSSILDGWMDKWINKWMQVVQYLLLSRCLFAFILLSKISVYLFQPHVLTSTNIFYFVLFPSTLMPVPCIYHIAPSECLETLGKGLGATYFIIFVRLAYCIYLCIGSHFGYFKYSLVF